VNKLASRITMAQKNVLDLVLDDIAKEFLLISKWGCNGSTGHSECKQQSLEDVTDSDIFYHICSSSSVVFSNSIWRYSYSLEKS
jgi:hypothetical protein